MKLKPINQQVVVIVGATSGIGRAAAIEFASRGAKVVIGGRSPDSTDTLANEIQRKGGDVIPVTVDVSDYAQVKKLADQAVEKYGRIDTWVHVAAVALYAYFEDTTPEEFDQVINVNLMGQVYGAMAALPYLKQEGRGALIHISSVTGMQSVPLQSAYSASKHGMNGFLKSLRMELEHDQIPISVTSILPPSLNTPFFAKAMTKTGVKPKPFPPVYDPQLAVDAILYAAEHPVRELTLGTAGTGFTFLQRLFPKLSDRALAKSGIQLQLTDQPKAVDSPSNMYQHINGFDTIKGEWGNEQILKSPITTLKYNRAIPWAFAAIISLVAGAVFIRPILQARPFKQLTLMDRIRSEMRKRG